ncbi:GGDEF domain-containing protein [Vibrio sp. LaRot3]|uniref:GGDEF domain-containing protein n=1 Tax=Vibrio sp. LaRot3 TaxID=2998829 RepID=UPI0022CDBCBE|nr:GGDEF domain-containing protein [Vibrio sp. LaRot3]MDA0147561.1 GGDEF domain-containing protein [Vibrio sp. LaRot3]
MYKKNPYILLISLMLIVLSVMLMVSSVLHIDSTYDLFFEANTFAILIYITYIGRDYIRLNAKLKIGAAILLFNKGYDVFTELAVVDTFLDPFEFLDTFLEDGLIQLAFLIIAFGLTEISAKLREQATKDELTGLYNRKKLTATDLDCFDLVYFDLNGLKKLNDTKGHKVGDLMIIRFAQVLKDQAHRDELIARVGGDEFVALTHPRRGQEYVEDITKTLEGEQISFAFGIQYGTKQNLEQALEKADLSMYQMKKASKEA